jgi:hypothetical protein
MQDLSDQQLVAALNRGDTRAFDAIYYRYRDYGPAGNDTFFARDGQRDQLVDGDAGHDRAQVDDDDVLEEIEELLP